MTERAGEESCHLVSEDKVIRVATSDLTLCATVGQAVAYTAVQPESSPTPSSPPSPTAQSLAGGGLRQTDKLMMMDDDTVGCPIGHQWQLLHHIPSAIKGDVISKHDDHPFYVQSNGDKPSSFRWQKRWTMALLIALLLIAILGCALYFDKDILLDSKHPKKNVILMISDGFGPASQGLARTYHQRKLKLPKEVPLPLDALLVGTSRTASSNSLVTDSAAGATAFSCAAKSYNGAIAVDPTQAPCGTILEAAKHSGYLTGLVVTSRITHATPAAFSAHVPFRDMESDIAFHQIGNYSLGRMTDIMFGGGACFFRPANGSTSAPSCRKDNTSVFDLARSLGWTVGLDRSYFDKLSPKYETADHSALPLMGLFTPDHMSYELDRNASHEPSLLEMSLKAIELLSAASKWNDKGFFLMIEGSRIDMAGHTNDPATQAMEVLMYNQVVAMVKTFVESNPNTILISTSDHETGGLSLATQLDPSVYPVYNWYPDALTGVRHSAEFVASTLLNGSFSSESIASLPYLLSSNRNNTSPSKTALTYDFLNATVCADWLNITDATSQEIFHLSTLRDRAKLEQFVGDMVSRRAQLGWSTHGHSAVDVNIYAAGTNATAFQGVHENTFIGDFIVNYLNLDLPAVTRRLREGAATASLWNQTLSNQMGASIAKEQTLEREMELSILHYHGGLED